jgi:hypothetical protein
MDIKKVLMSPELESELRNSSSPITHHFLLLNKFPAILTANGRFLIIVNNGQGYSDYREFKLLMTQVPPEVRTNLAYLAIFNKLEEFYKAHENNTLWKLLPSLHVSTPPTTEE